MSSRRGGAEQNDLDAPSQNDEQRFARLALAKDSSALGDPTLAPDRDEELQFRVCQLGEERDRPQSCFSERYHAVFPPSTASGHIGRSVRA